MAKTLVSSLPNNIGLVVFGALFLIIVLTIIKLVVAIFKMVSLKMMLNKNLISSSNEIYIVNSTKPFAFCFGIRNPKIYLSTKIIKILTKKELEVVIAHESYHLKSHDTQVLTLATILESLTPYFPVLTDLIRNYKIERELLADQFAISNSNHKNLMNVLKKLLKQNIEFDYAGLPAIADVDTLEVRINRLINNKKFSKKYSLRNIVISSVCLSIFIFLILIPVKTTELHATGSDAVILCVDKKMSSYYTL